MKIWQETTNFRHLAIIVPVVDLWLGSKGIKIKMEYLALVVVSGFVLMWVIGILWDKAHMNHYEAEFSNQRNPLALKTLRELRIISRLLRKK